MIYFKLVLSLFVFVSYSKPVKITVPEIIRTISHKSRGYTQGFFIQNDTLIEGTGLFKKSKIYLISLKDGKILKQNSLPIHFGEGLVLHHNQKIYQLTWKAQKVLIWDYPSLTLQDSIAYQGEGWGLTQDNSHFIMSNGSDTLTFRDHHFKKVKKLAITYKNKPMKGLNELEYAHQSIYANVYLTSYILRIDPKTGVVIEIIDCQNLINFDSTQKQNDEVLNGIAYNSKTDLFYLTGKNWNLIFEVKIPYTTIY